jgi:hypothetical protein
MNGEWGVARPVLEGKANKVYLMINQEYAVDVLDKQTDTIVCRYLIKRLELIPTVVFNRKTKNGYNLTSVAQAGRITISPGDSLTFNTVSDSIPENKEVVYILTNLSAKKYRSQVGESGFGPLKLAAGTRYELLVSYSIQRESANIYYIDVQPYWYRTGTIYIIAVIILLGIGLITATLVLKTKVRSSQKEQQKLQQAAIRLQSLLNPHFTFNALSSIQGLMNTERIEEANNYLQEFSSLLRQTLAKSQDVFNSLDQELEMMGMYLKLEAFRFNFSWDIIISPTLNPSTIEIPTLLLQPLIENAIKHGLPGLGDKAQLLIICKEVPETDNFIIVIKDNGTWVEKSHDSGYGLSLTAERIKTINKLRKEQSIELIFDKENGTEAILTFHNWLN